MEIALFAQPADGRSAPDEDVVAASGDGTSAGELCVAALVERHAATLYRYAYRLTGTVHDAEDLVQQTFVVAQQKLHTVEDPQRVVGWLLTTLRRLFYRTLRKRGAVPASAVDVEVAEIPAAEPRLDGWDREDLQRALDALPANFRIVLLMFYFENCSYQEIADQLEIPVGTVMSRLSRAKSHLRAVLAARDRTQPTTQPTTRGTD